MATYENKGVLNFKDNDGNLHKIYPSTKSEQVEGLDAKVAEKVGDTAPKAHASTHKTGGSDAIAPSDIGAAPSSHGHAWGDITEKPSTFTPAFHNHAWDEITGKPSTFTPASHSHAWSEVTGKPDTFAPAAHNQGANTITAGTFAATGVKAMNGTDYTTARIRNIQASTTDLTAGSSSLANGDIYLVYE